VSCRAGEPAALRAFVELYQRALLSRLLGQQPGGGPGSGDVSAGHPRAAGVRGGGLGAAVDVELSIGAHIRWSGKAGRNGAGADEPEPEEVEPEEVELEPEEVERVSCARAFSPEEVELEREEVELEPEEVEQDGGEVTYRVSLGADFRVRTPYGSVTVLGTVFRVVVAGRGAGGEPVNNRWVIAGASATLGGALLWVSVEHGEVRLAQGEDELVLGAGQSGAIGSDGIPRLATAEPSAPPNGHVAEPPDAARARARQVADAVRRHAARRRAEGALSSASAKPTASTPSAATATPAPPPSADEEMHRRQYIQRTMREQYYSVARACYAELLERQPDARGRITLEFAIVGDGDAGVVDRVSTRDDETSLDDPEFAMCMRESLYTAVFEPPPPGASETTIVYPIMLAPN
jgi:hypothetical protein